MGHQFLVSVVTFCILLWKASAAPKCPTVGNQQPTYLPDPDNCANFYECSNSMAIKLVCPTGLYFNPTKDACDYPDNVDCGTRGTTPKPGAPTPVPTTGEEPEPTTKAPTAPPTTEPPTQGTSTAASTEIPPAETSKLPHTTTPILPLPTSTLSTILPSPTAEPTEGTTVIPTEIPSEGTSEGTTVELTTTVSHTDN